MDVEGKAERVWPLSALQGIQVRVEQLQRLLVSGLDARGKKKRKQLQLPDRHQGCIEPPKRLDAPLPSLTRLEGTVSGPFCAGDSYLDIIPGSLVPAWIKSTGRVRLPFQSLP